LELLEEQRGIHIDVDRSVTLDWDSLRKKLAENGMRNSNVMAIAPTATISTIVGVCQSIEPVYKHLYVKSNLSGEFTQVTIDLVEELKGRGLWDSDMVEALKYYDGSVQEIERVPADLKARYHTSFEVDPEWIIKCAARRQKWIDMGQSLNLYLAEPSGKKLQNMYMSAWEKGLKTTYYLRTLAATQVEKSTVDINKFGVQPRWMKSQSASADIELNRESAVTEMPATAVTSACSLDDDCEACQ
jgi:ribonucleoside-diphosphate reductase alpha chain